MSISASIEIDRPANEVWQIVGPGFATVGEWATSVSSATLLSAAHPHTPEAPGSGRACSVAGPGLDTMTEELSSYDPAARSLTYQVTQGLPSITSSAGAHWEVTEVSPQRCRVTASGGFELTPRWSFMTPGLDLYFRRIMVTTLNELKVYAETGQPPRAKARALARAAARDGAGSPERSALDLWVLANAAFCATSGTLIAANSHTISPHLGGLPRAAIVVGGAALIDYGAMLSIVGARGVNPRVGRVFAGLDGAWVLGSVVGLARFNRHISGRGAVAVTGIATIVGVFGSAQWVNADALERS